MEENAVAKWFIGIGVVMLAVFLLGWYGLGLKETFGTADRNIDHKIFKNSTAYVDGMIDDLAKYKFEMQTEESVTGKKAIADLIRDRYSNFDETAIENEELKQFLNDVRNGKY